MRKSRLSRVMPALLTRMSISPTSARACSKARLVESHSETLPSEAWMLKPCERISRSHRSLRSDPGPHPAMTVWPSLHSRRQMAVPMPPMPPVT